MQTYIQAHATGGGAKELIDSLLAQIETPVAGGTLGFIYVTDCLASELEFIVRHLKNVTAVPDWVGTVGVGLCVNGLELYDGPAVVMLITDIQSSQYCLFESRRNQTQVRLINCEFGKEAQPSLAVMHGNPMVPECVDLFSTSCDEYSMTFFVGGLSSSNFEHPQILGDQITKGVLSGVFLNSTVNVIVAHTQGCTPLRQKHLITRSEHNIVQEIDGRPALEVFKEDVGEVLAKDLNRAGSYIFAGFPIEGSDVGDYIVRNLIGFDAKNQNIIVGDYVQDGQQMMFCRRDGNSARFDLERMLLDIKQRLTQKPKGALYYSCLGRGRHQFGDNSEELKAIEAALPGVPMVGFFANGEIYNNKLYGYTGVLTVFY